MYGVTAPEAPAPPPGFAAKAPESPSLDPWAEAAADPWANASAQAPAAQASTPEADAWALDAFGKGKSKGEPGGPLQCYNCLGKGHPQFLGSLDWAVSAGTARARAYLSTENVPVQGQLWLWVQALYVLEEKAWEQHGRFLATGKTLAAKSDRSRLFHAP